LPSAWRLLSAALLERWLQVCRVKITFTKLLTNRFVSTTRKSMECVLNWIPLRIRVRSRNTQPHLKGHFFYTLYSLSDNSFKKTLCLMNNCPQVLLLSFFLSSLTNQLFGLGCGYM